MKHELFKENIIVNKKTITCSPPILFPQERDWSCSIACIRTLLSAVSTNVEKEDFYIKKYELKPHSYYSKDIKELHMLDNYNVLYGCDKKYNFDDILNIAQDGFYIMLESAINCGHWLVFLGYFPLKNKDNISEHKILLYDPYYDDMKLMNADEFINMWIDFNYANTKIEKDFIAIKK